MICFDDRCDVSGVVVRARVGHVAAGGWRFGEGVTLGPDMLTPEGLADNWYAITR